MFVFYEPCQFILLQWLRKKWLVEGLGTFLDIESIKEDSKLVVRLETLKKLSCTVAEKKVMSENMPSYVCVLLL